MQIFVDLGVDVCANHNLYARYASIHGNLAVVRYLVGVGADIHDQTGMCVGEASWGKHVAIVRYLVGLGADPRALDDLAIRWAYTNESAETIQYLVEVGANIHKCGDIPSSRIERYLASGRATLLSNGASHSRAAQQLYFGWIPQCYDQNRRSGRRMARRNFHEYLRI